jgi:hypothetical protein
MHMYVTFRVEKVARISSQCTYLCNFQKTIQIKQSPNTRKFAQSGHPGQEQQKERKKEKSSKPSSQKNSSGKNRTRLRTLDSRWRSRHLGIKLYIFMHCPLKCFEKSVQSTTLAFL